MTPNHLADIAVLVMIVVSFCVIWRDERKARRPRLPDDLSYRAYQAARNGATADGRQFTRAVVLELPWCPLCHQAFAPPDEAAQRDMRPRTVVCQGRRTVKWHDDMVGPLMHQAPVSTALIPCGWTGLVYFSRPQQDPA